MTESYKPKPPYDAVEHKKETINPETNHLGLTRIYRSPKKEHLPLLVQIALRHGLRVELLEELATKKSRINIEIIPLPGRAMPNWQAFWEEYRRAKKK